MSGFSSSDPLKISISDPFVQTKFADSSDKDSFGRLRVSNPFSVFTSKQIYDGGALFWSTKSENNGDILYSSTRSSSILSVDGSSGSKAIRQTKQRFNYQPGRSYQIIMSFRFSAENLNVRKKIGYFDENDGIFLQNLNGTTSLVIRNNSVDNIINQSSWNIDKFDGNDESQINIDFSKVQILIIDMQWLGVGRVRIGFSIDGVIYNVHYFLHTNLISSVYMRTPNLPLRGEIENISNGEASSLEMICASIDCTGGFQRIGLLFSADRGNSVLASVGNLLYPLVSIRLDASKPGITVIPIGIDILCTTNNASFRWVLIMNPTINGTDNALWENISNSNIQYDISRNISNTLSGGYIISSGYGVHQASIKIDLEDTAISLGVNLENVSDQFILAVQKVDDGTDSFIGSIQWKQFE